jgi:hypothetical protein
LKICLYTRNILQNNILEHEYTVATCSAARRSSPGSLFQTIRHDSPHVLNSLKMASFEAEFELGKEKEIGCGQV